MTVRVLIADDQALVRAGFKMIVNAEPDLEVVGEAGDGATAIELARAVAPDGVLMDVRMPGMDGLEATRRLLAGPGPHPRVLVLTTFDADEYVHQALTAGASGFLLKESPPEQLLHAIRTVESGDALLAPTVVRRLVQHFFSGRPLGDRDPRLTQLTPRELEVLTLVAAARSNAEIAKALFLSEATVKTHLSRVLMKLGLRDRLHAVVFAYEQGVVRVGSGPLDDGAAT